MNEKKKKNSEYGEYICSFFEWLPLSKQKERAKELNDMTKNEEMEKKRENNRKKEILADKLSINEKKKEK